MNFVFWKQFHFYSSINPISSSFTLSTYLIGARKLTFPSLKYFFTSSYSFVQECMDAFVESMAGDDYVLTRSDVLYMQLLLQHFDSLSALTQAAASSHAPRPELYLDCDPKAVAGMRRALDVGHVRTAADGPKRTPRKSVIQKEVEYS